MKRKLTVIVVALLLLGVILSTIDVFGKNERWTYIEDEYYRVLPVDMEKPVLFNRLGEDDYIEILNALVDKNSEPLSIEEMKMIEDDPNAVFVDNLLPNGQYLVENWIDIQTAMINSKFKIGVLDDFSVIRSPSEEEIIQKIKTGFNEIELTLKKVIVNGKSIVIPKNMDDFPLQFSITPDGMKSIISSDNGLWIFDKSGDKLIKISSEYYDGKSYDELVKESYDLYDENKVIWNDDVVPSPDSSKLVYSSNKNRIETSGASLFVFDLTSGKEYLIADTLGANYLVDGWVTSESIVSQKISSDGISYVLITTDGKETELKMKGESPIVYAVRDGMIAYTSSLSSGSIHVSKLDEQGNLYEIASLELEGQTRLRPGINGFSPDNSYFSFIYVESDQPGARRYLKVLDLLTGKVIDLKSLPGNSTSRVLEFNWLNNKELLILIKEDIPGVKKVSTWKYSLN